MSEPLFIRPLIFVAHQDDETIGAGILMQRAQDPLVVFATDGASEDPYFWKAHGTRQRLAEVRQQEAHRVLAIADVASVEFLGFPDQKLHRHAPDAIRALTDIARRETCTAIVTHAYEGGHPDHDTCSYIAHVAGQQTGLRVWEMPLYHRAQGVLTKQIFLQGDAELELLPTESESARKQQMFAAYVSQGDLAQTFPATSERFRRQPQYDYTRPPHRGPLNYEAWQWTITGMEVSQALAQAMGAHQ